MMTPRPLGSRVLVRQDQPSDKIGNLYVPDVAGKNYPNTGTVIAMGPKADPELRAGMRVMFVRQPGSALVPDDRDLGARADPMRDLLMLKEENVVAIIEDAP